MHTVFPEYISCPGENAITDWSSKWQWCFDRTPFYVKIGVRNKNCQWKALYSEFQTPVLFFHNHDTLLNFMLLFFLIILTLILSKIHKKLPKMPPHSSFYTLYIANFRSITYFFPCTFTKEALNITKSPPLAKLAHTNFL